MYSLRPYQRDAVQAIENEWKSQDSTLLVLPTGTGKTVVFSEIIRRAFPRRTLVLCHRKELIFQAKEHIERSSGFRVDVEMAEFHAETGGLFNEAQVIVSSIQTQNAGGDGGGRMSKFLPEDFGYLICDEGHHSTASGWRRVIDYYRQNPRLKVLGVTATPDRADEEALGQVFDSVAFDYEILEAIHDGWLVPTEQRMIHIEGLDFSQVRTTAGDLNGADLAAVMEAEKNLQGIAEPIIQISGNRRALVFTASVAQAERMSDILCRHKPGSSAWVCGKTDKDERRNMLRDFAAGKIQYVVNVGCLTEGFDDPGVELVFMGRPTKSRSLYAQMAGRAMRPAEDIAHDLNDVLDAEARRAMIAASKKPVCEIIDFVGNSGRHKLITTADILGGNVSDEAIERATERAKREGGLVRMDKLLDEEEEKLKAEKEERRLVEEARKARLVAKVKWSAHSVNPFDVFDLAPRKERGWDSGKMLSQKQTDLLLKQGINPDGMPYSQAKQLLNEIFRRFDGSLCSFKQAKLLKKYGYNSNMSRDEAKQTIDVLAKNNWIRKSV
jgi:superfamily II DNA or RNA helicase